MATMVEMAMPTMIELLRFEVRLGTGVGVADAVASVDVELTVGAGVVDGSCVLVIEPSIPV